MADEAMFDAALFDHERQQTDDDDNPAMDGAIQPASPRRKTAEEKAAENLDRQRRGDRQDWRDHIRPAPGSGYRLAEEWTLSKRQKMARTRAIQAAITRRQGRQPVAVPPYHRGERRIVRAELVEAAKRQKEREAVFIYGPYDLSACETRTWEVELRKAINWFVDAFGGPERPDEKYWRERQETGRALNDAGFGNDPTDGWDWSYEAPHRDEMDPAAFHAARRWCSPSLPPSTVKAIATLRREAEAGWPA